MEDQDAVRDLGKRVLEDAGYAVYSAQDGFEALRIAASLGRSIDLLLTNVVIPGMNGPELAMELRRHQPSVKVLYMSGFTGDAPLGDQRPGGAPMLQKPFTPTTLAQRVRSILDG